MEKFEQSYAELSKNLIQVPQPQEKKSKLGKIKLNINNPINIVILFICIFVVLFVVRPGFVKTEKNDKKVLSVNKLIMYSILFTIPYIIWYFVVRKKIN